jgi:thioredoxin-like negative regulator of GroEL
MAIMKLRLRGLALAIPLLFAMPLHAAALAPDAQVAWLSAAADSDVARAFAQARTEGKPLLVYWGAKWCPPCNQLKATLFNRQDFIERSRAFVAVNIDGDLPGAQKLGARFKVRGYPTMILFTPEGSEITRLPGEADAPQVLELLQAGLAGGRPVKAVLDDARAGRALPANEWRMLAFYSWDSDEQQLVPTSERAALLARLAVACPAGERESATRLWLKALAAAGDAGPRVKPDAALRQRALEVLGDARATRAQMDVLTNWPAEIARSLAPQGSAQRAPLLAAFDGALQRLQHDVTLSRADRMGALLGRVELARIDVPDGAKTPPLAPLLLAELRDEAARADREISDGYERQAVITAAAQMLERAGLSKESDALLEANLAKSHSPYYLMSQLAGNAKRRGDKARALQWYAQAWDRSEGPATRLQWGASYLGALVELAPQDAARIEQTAARLIDEAAAGEGSFYERSGRSLQRAGATLQRWNANGAHEASVRRLRGQLDAVCSRLDAGDPQRATCQGVSGALLKPAAAKGLS